MRDELEGLERSLKIREAGRAQGRDEAMRLDAAALLLLQQMRDDGIDFMHYSVAADSLLDAPAEQPERKRWEKIAGVPEQPERGGGDAWIAVPAPSGKAWEVHSVQQFPCDELGDCPVVLCDSRAEDEAGRIAAELNRCGADPRVMNVNEAADRERGDDE